MQPWKNQNLIKDNSIGFIYIIYHKLNGKFYVGKKNLYAYKTIKGKKIFTDSNWEKYMGSNKDFLDYIKTENIDNFEREILYVADTKIKLTYYELRYQILYDWTSEKCFNSNILGKFFKSKIIN